MKRIKLDKVNETIYKEVLSNGLTIYIYKKPNFQRKYAFFETRYGSINNVFVPFGKKEFRDVPLGIAHFLEHKLFESNEDENVFEAFEKDGAYVNAATSYEKTYYYFNTVDNFDSCLTRLIDFVQSPYLTDENVEKEKGIIAQELDMRKDNPDFFMYSKLVNNALIKSQYKYDVGGTKEDVNKITKEDLYDCYNTFYHPSNMTLYIAGDVDVKKTIELVKKNQESKNYKKENKIIQKTFKEPNEVDIKEEKVVYNVKSKKVGYAYKMLFDKMSDEKLFKFRIYLDIYFRLLFGSTSSFEDDLVKQGVIKTYMDSFFEHFKGENETFLVFFITDPIDEDKFEKLLINKLNERKDYKEMFELYKKKLISDYIRRFESQEAVLSLIRLCNQNYESILDNYYENISSINYDEFVNVINELHFDNYVKLVLDEV